MAASTSTSAMVVEVAPQPSISDQEQPQQQHQPGTQDATRQPVVTDMVTLRLMPKRKKKKSVKWAEDVVDNEFAGKKSSKKCCIFHRQRKFGEWSDEEDSDKECEC